MSTRAPLTTPALSHPDALSLRRALRDSADVTVFVDGTAVKLPDAARVAVLDVLRRLAAHDAVTTSSLADTLTTAQAAEAAGISPTYLRNLTDAGIIPVEYRGSHRRIRLGDIRAWVARQGKPDSTTP